MQRHVMSALALSALGIVTAQAEPLYLQPDRYGPALVPPADLAERPVAPVQQPREPAVRYAATQPQGAMGGGFLEFLFSGGGRDAPPRPPSSIEMGATAVVRFKVLKDEARAKRIVWPRFSHPGYFAKHEQNFIATMGMPVTDDGRQENADLNLAARNAVIRMIELLEERGWTREQAYVLCSVAVDLRVSNVVDVPNVTVSALLPEAIFAG